MAINIHFSYYFIPFNDYEKSFLNVLYAATEKIKFYIFRRLSYLLKPLHVQLAFTAIHTINRATKTIFFSHPLKAMNMESTNQNIWTFSLCWVFSTKNDFQIYKLWRASCWGTPNWLKFRQSRVRRGWDPIWTHLFEQFERKSAYLM